MNYPLIKPKYYHELLTEIIAFIRRPEMERDAQKTTRMKVYDTIGLFVLKIFFLVLLGALMAIVSPWFDPENLSKSRMSERFSFPLLLLVGGVILPLVEEVCFRLSLKFKPIYLALTTSTLAYYILTKLVFDTAMSMVDDSFLLRVGISLGLGIISYPLLSTKRAKKSLTHFWKRNVSWIYYVSCLSFAWLHIFNYELSYMNMLLLPVITLPQLMSAVINGYTRLAFGFQYPLLFHFTNNIVAISLAQLPYSDLLAI